MRGNSILWKNDHLVSISGARVDWPRSCRVRRRGDGTAVSVVVVIIAIVFAVVARCVTRGGTLVRRFWCCACVRCVCAARRESDSLTFLAVVAVRTVIEVLLRALANKPCLMSAAIFFTLVVVVVVAVRTVLSIVVVAVVVVVEEAEEAAAAAAAIATVTATAVAVDGNWDCGSER